jgi:DNA polymerase-4
VRRRVRDEVGLTASIGVASTKFLAKLASELAKPDGLLVVAPGTERAFLAPLPVSRLWGVGPSTLRRLDRMAIRTIGDVAALPEEVLTTALGVSLGRHLRALAVNDDARAVVPDRDAKSIGAEETYATDLHTRDACERELVRLADKVGGRLRHAGLLARTITLKVRFANFETRTRSRTLGDPTDVTGVVLDTARDLLATIDVTRGIRLLGISLSQFDAGEAAPRLLDLDDDERDGRVRFERRAAVERAVDDVRDRFGNAAVRPATLVDRPSTTESGPR